MTEFHIGQRVKFIDKAWVTLYNKQGTIIGFRPGYDADIRVNYDCFNTGIWFNTGKQLQLIPQDKLYTKMKLRIR